MQKTIFNISKMDCPSEEHMIRMRLERLLNIKALDFDIPNRKLTVFHTDNYQPILEALDSLKFDTSLVTSTISENISFTEDKTQQKRLLIKVLVINFFFFVLELATGFISNSMGLIADSLDMLADSIVYGLALFAVGGTVGRKMKVTKISGYLQLLLSILGLVEVIKRFISVEPPPVYQTMVIISTLALLGNYACLHLLQKSKSKESHMRASMIFTSNDVVVNLGVIVAGALVYITHSKFPDLIVGLIVFLIVGNGAFKILKLSSSQ